MSVPDVPRDSVQEVLEEGPSRYAAYLMRLKTLALSSSRYVAYTSDLGEAIRPLTSPNVVRAAYGISWCYLIGDVGYAGYRAKEQHDALKGLTSNLEPSKTELRKKNLEPVDKEGSIIPIQAALPHSENQHIGLIMARRAVFQSLASMALPAFTIHSVVRYSAPLFAKSARPRVRSMGPTLAGLAVVPALPFLFDEPVEHVVDTAFDWAEEKYFGTAKPSHGHEAPVKEKTESPTLPPGVPASSSGSLLSSAAQLAILGIGVDAVHLPRVGRLLSRQAARLKRTGEKWGMPPGMPGLGAGVSVARGGGVEGWVGKGKGEANSDGGEWDAAMWAMRKQAEAHLVKRVLCERERKEWRGMMGHVEGPWSVDENRQRWIAVRLAIKEATYKALYPTLRLRWTDIEVFKPSQDAPPHDALPSSEQVRGQLSDRVGGTREESSGKPNVRLSDEFRRRNDGVSRVLDLVRETSIHVSVSHDGEYVVAFVVAEGGKGTVEKGS